MIIVNEYDIRIGFKGGDSRNFETLKEANQYLVEKGYIFDSDDEYFSYWFYNKYNYATVFKI